MRKTFFLLLFLLFPYLLFPQRDFSVSSRQQIDSLQKLLPGSELEKRVDILNELASNYTGINFDSSIFYCSRAARLSTNVGYTKGIGLARYNTGNAYYYKMDFKNAMISYLSAQSILEKGTFSNELGDVNLMIGNINYFIRRGDKAVSSYKKAIKFYMEAGSENSLFKVYDAMSMAIYFLEYGSMDSALVYGYKMLDHSRKYHDRYSEAFTLMQIGNFYCASNKSIANKQKALVYSDSALAVASDIKNGVLVSIIYVTKGNYYDWFTPFFETTGDLSKARYYYEKAYQVSMKTGCSWLQAVLLARLAMLVS